MRQVLLGQPVPDFELPATNEEIVESSGLNEKSKPVKSKGAAASNEVPKSGKTAKRRKSKKSSNSIEIVDGKVKLSSLLGRRVLLYFYPKDLTTACTQQACDLRDASPSFEKANTVIIGISTDEVKTHNKFIEKYQLPFVLLADPEHEVCEMFGVWQEKKLYGHTFMGIVRSTFLIDETGVLVKEWRNIRVKGHVEEVLKAMS